MLYWEVDNEPKFVFSSTFFATTEICHIDRVSFRPLKINIQPSFFLSLIENVPKNNNHYLLQTLCLGEDVSLAQGSSTQIDFEAKWRSKKDPAEQNKPSISDQILKKHVKWLFKYYKIFIFSWDSRTVLDPLTCFSPLVFWRSPHSTHVTPWPHQGCLG